jgi:hypothetical protein
MSDDVTALRAELAALRRRVHGLALLLLVLVASAGLLLARGRDAAAGPLSEAGDLHAMHIEAQVIRLLDPDGNLRVLLKVPPAGPSLSLLDERGRAAVTLSASPAEIDLTDSDGQVRLKATVGADGPSLQLLGTDGRAAAELKQGAGGAGLRLTDSTGRVLLERP